MPFTFSLASPAALAADPQYRLVSRLLDSFGAWWQPPAALATAVVAVAAILWLSRRDGASLPRAVAITLRLLRLTAVAAVAVALCDIERIAEHEILLPSRVAVLIDSSASMSLVDSAAGPPAANEAAGTEPAAAADRSTRAQELLKAGGLLAALGNRQEVSLWRFDADAEPLAAVPRRGPDAPAAAAAPVADWQASVAAGGYETRLGEAVQRILDREPAAALAGIVVLSDGGNNAGVDPLAAADAARRAGVAIEVIGIGSEVLPANLRVADLVAPARVFPDDGFAVTAYLQSQGMEGRRVEVELLEQADGLGAALGPGRVLGSRDTLLGGDGDITAVRFDVAGLVTPGSRMLTVRVRPPATDRIAADDSQSAAIEVVDRVTEVLLIAGGPGREYQFMRNLLDRDPSFAVDVLLGTAVEGISQDARRILAAFPPSDESLAEYDVVVAIDPDWLAVGPAGWSRLERWVSQAGGGLVLIAGGIHQDSWLRDPRSEPLRGLFPVQLRPGEQLSLGGPLGRAEPLPLAFTRDGLEAEFLWLADSRATSAAVWAEFPGVYACGPADELKPGATAYALAAPPRSLASEPQPIYLAGQYYGAGSVIYVGSGELWRLRGIDDAAYERLVPQLLRRVSQGRLSQGGRLARLLVDRDRHPVGSTVHMRLVLAAERPAAVIPPLTCRVTGPTGETLTVPLAASPERPGTLLGGFVASREGTWQIEVDPLPGEAERLVHRIQAQLPDRELARPQLDRPLLEQMAVRSGGRAWFPETDGWTAADATALAAALPDRSRREYEAGVADPGFKQTLNAILLAIGCGSLCLEWVIRRLVKLA
ncbi:MAG: hypothetical protein RLZZ440_3013 [Planctomycetota bacterium]